MIDHFRNLNLHVDLGGNSVGLITRLAGLKSSNEGDAGDTANVGGIGGFHEGQSRIEQSLFRRCVNGGDEGNENLKKMFF